IDAPEKTQLWSDHARKGLRKLIDGQMLRIEMVERDRYERIIARVYRVRDNLYINARMIDAGHAWVYRRYTDDKQFIDGEKNARENGVGLWQLPEHERIPPWEWRKENEES
ncbi:MAG: thermonuclease family protein, partial [Gammaproteobacteria bacterium]|nr:thermonuclease family protein [Gammaproteobacteria bacterium]